jgi:hypothetical protein
MNTFLRRFITASVLTLSPLLSVAQSIMCGLGPPPGTPEFERSTKRIEDQRKRLGFLLVCDGNMDRYRFESQIAEDSVVRRKLAFEPRSLDGTRFSELQFLGSIADGFLDKGAVMYRRVFRGTDGEIITIQEFSLQDGAHVNTGRDDGFQRVRGADAQLTVVQATSGKGFSQLTWPEDSSYFEVTIDRGVDEGRSRARLIGLAQSLPTGR